MDTKRPPTTTGIDPDAIDLPSALGAAIQRTFDLDARPETYGEWARSIAASAEAARDRPISTADLCSTEDSPHAAIVGGERTHFLCAQDPLIVGLLAEEPVTVESRPPNRDETVRIHFADDGSVSTDPEGALLSFGIAPDRSNPGPVTPAAMYELVCPYGHAFPDDEAYDAWAASTDAETDVLSVPAGIAAMAALLEAAGIESGGVGGRV